MNSDAVTSFKAIKHAISKENVVPFNAAHSSYSLRRCLPQSESSLLKPSRSSNQADLNKLRAAVLSPLSSDKSGCKLGGESVLRKANEQISESKSAKQTRSSKS